MGKGGGNQCRYRIFIANRCKEIKMQLILFNKKVDFKGGGGGGGITNVRLNDKFMDGL